MVHVAPRKIWLKLPLLCFFLSPATGANRAHPQPWIDGTPPHTSSAIPPSLSHIRPGTKIQQQYSHQHTDTLYVIASKSVCLYTTRVVAHLYTPSRDDVIENYIHTHVRSVYSGMESKSGGAALTASTALAMSETTTRMNGTLHTSVVEAEGATNFRLPKVLF